MAFRTRAWALQDVRVLPELYDAKWSSVKEVEWLNRSGYFCPLGNLRGCFQNKMLLVTSVSLASAQRETFLRLLVLLGPTHSPRCRYCKGGRCVIVRLLSNAFEHLVERDLPFWLNIVQQSFPV